MKTYKIIDAHCDTISKIFDNNESLFQNSCHIDIKRLKNFKGFVQFFAVWIDDYYAKNNPFTHTIRVIDKFYNEIEKNNDVFFIKNKSDFENVILNNKIGAILTIEGGEAIMGDMAMLRTLYTLGVRSVTLTWNRRNELGDSSFDTETNYGLSSFGRSAVLEMNKLGIIIDVSHLNIAGFWDVINISNKPIIASHSNSYEICKHKRNLTNEQFLALIKNGGVCGINLYPEFLSNDKNADIDDIIRHIEHFLSLGGENNIGIGCDFDGIDSLPKGINGVEDLYTIFDKMLSLNYNEDLIDKIAHKNFERVITKNLNN